MSTEEIIDAWKHNGDDPEKQSNGPQNQPGKKAPVNPAGEQEISDEDLEAIEGGVLGSLTCNGNSC